MAWLQALGDQRPTTVLRSVALGYLAEPDSLDLLYDQVCNERARSDTEPSTADGHDHGQVDADAVPVDEPHHDHDTPGTDVVLRPDAVARRNDPEVARRKDPEIPEAFHRPGPGRLPATTVCLHLDRGSGTWSMDGTGAITAAEARDIVGHTRVTVKPVIDLAANYTYTGYIAPPRLKEQLALLNAGVCTFPYCDRPARRGEYDHIINYDPNAPPGSPGATDSRNGHRLCTFHHRAKTFTDWTVQSPAPGVWLWHSPANRTYLVTAGSTTRMDTHHRQRERPHAA